uniref:N-alpha-acetyltransferase 30 n=1 Tax=Astyanax mexicanus TaxID=7994 RepID=A0A3B1KLN0_ASTMX
MTAVPPGPSGGALSASPAKVCFFPGDGCALPAGGDPLEWPLKDPGQEREVRGRGVERMFPEVHTNCQALERQINGLKCAGLTGVDHSTPESQPRAAMELQDSRVGTLDGLHNNSCSRLCFPHHHALNTNGDSSIRDRLTLPRTELSHSHTRLEEGAVLACQTDGPVEQLSRLDLNHSPSRETGPAQEIKYVRYESELQMPGIMRLITKDLSEPYSIYTYRYFIHNWPQLCFLAVVDKECVGAIVCKLDMHKKMFRRGYIAMLAVDSKHRRKSIGTNLVKKAIYAMVDGDCDEVVLETEITNKSALKLYENLGFVRDKRLFRYYLNGVDALRLKLWLR